VSEPLPLAEAARRLRRPPGRPRRLETMAPAGLPIQGAGPEPAPAAAIRADFAAPLLPRGLPIPAASSYSGLPIRRLWSFIASGVLPAIRVPGVRRVLLDRLDLDRLLEEHRQGGPQ
jgi:hypothetical protein